MKIQIWYIFFMSHSVLADQQLTDKFVAVLNKKVPVPKLMNVLGHMAAGLAGSAPDLKAMRFDNYFDKDGGVHQSISDNGFIILQADNSNKIRTLRNKLLETGIHFTDFTSTMTVGTYQQQQERTAQTPESELDYWGVCMFGNKELLNTFTKKFSLWR